jgi:mannose-6-phosphate isomerase-like protein (cupin superfamily)
VAGCREAANHASLITSDREEEMTMMLRNLCSVALLLGMSSTAVAAEVAPPRKLSAAELDRMVASPSRGAAMGTLPVGERGPKVLVMRRTKSGEAEVHDALNDVFLVRSGRATVTVGGTVTGNRQTSPGEWRGGTIAGASNFEVGPGDVLWIPAGVPHQIIVPDNGDFSYLAFKSAK